MEHFCSVTGYFVRIRNCFVRSRNILTEHRTFICSVTEHLLSDRTICSIWILKLFGDGTFLFRHRSRCTDTELFCSIKEHFDRTQNIYLFCLRTLTFRPNNLFDLNFKVVRRWNIFVRSQVTLYGYGTVLFDQGTFWPNTEHLFVLSQNSYFQTEQFVRFEF
jgi:hypothetical protein